MADAFGRLEAHMTKNAIRWYTATFVVTIISIAAIVWYFGRKKGFRARGGVEPLLGGYYQPMCHSNWLGLRVGMCRGSTNGPMPVIDAPRP